MNREFHFLKVALAAKRSPVDDGFEDAYQMHCWIDGLKKPTHNPEVDRILWRLEYDKRGLSPVVLIQTNFAPNPDGLKAMANIAMIQAVEEKRVQPVFQEHQMFRFRLRANPTKSLAGGEGKRGRREAVLGAADAETWLVRQGAKHGFSCSLFNLIEEGAVILKKEKDRARKSTYPAMTFNSVLYEGMLQVRDPNQMAKVFEKGLGRGKGFGFGLLSLARR